MSTSTKDYDVVVLGAGAGGMTAACVAAAEGLRVLLLDKAPQVGGTTAISGGMVWMPANAKMAQAGIADSADAARAYLEATIPGDYNRPVREAFLGHADAAVAYLEAHTAVRLQPVRRYPDYYPDLPGATLGGRVLEAEPFDAAQLGADFALLRAPLPEFMLFGKMMVGRPDIPQFLRIGRSWSATRRVVGLLAAYAFQRLRHPRGTSLVLGNALAGRLLLSLRRLGVDLRLGAPAAGLVVEGGAVVGVRLDGGAGVVRARKGVVVATGGFSHDPSLRARFQPDAAPALSATCATASGDGIRAAVAAGAALEARNANHFFWVPASRYRRRDGTDCIYPHTVTDRGKPGVIAVNSRGRRFVNEAVSYHEFVTAMLRPGNDGPAVPAWLICDRTFLWRYGLGAVRPMALSLSWPKSSGYLVEAPSIAALAACLGIDAAALTATVERFNRDAEHGEDSEFHRGADAYQRHLGDATVTPNPCVRSIRRAPFYAVRVEPADLGTATGLAVDAAARVLDAGGAPIPGLYACGNDMASIMNGAYPGPGITLGPALTFGYLAGRSLAAT
jgi:succinate dehydrogenase/fumarate reductase flavoprotein subunit